MGGGGVRILTWNILHGGGPRRTPEIALDILEQRPDVVILCEFRPGRGGQLRAVLADHGLTHQACASPTPTLTPRSASAAPTTPNTPTTAPNGARTDDPGKNSILIASRWPVEVLAEDHGIPDKLRPRWLAVRLTPAPGLGGEEDALDLLGVHIPDDTRPTAKAEVWQGVLSFAGPRAAGRCIIAGDTNSGRHRVDEVGASFGCVTALGKLATMGYVDAWRRANPDSRETTWSHPFVGATRIDGVYVSASLAGAVTRAQLLHGPREAGHSDHSMVLVELG